jgi:hypothetical protein
MPKTKKYEIDIQTQAESAPTPAKTDGPKQLVLYSKTQPLSCHYGRNPGEFVSIEQGENLIDVDKWNKVKDRTGVKAMLNKGVMLDKGPAPQGYKVRTKKGFAGDVQWSNRTGEDALADAQKAKEEGAERHIIRRGG